MNGLATGVLFAAKKVGQYQTPPFVRPCQDEVLLLRQPASDEVPHDTWRFPIVGEVEHPGELEHWVDWTDNTCLARIEASFTPANVSGPDYFWCPLTAALICKAVDPTALPALRRLALDQIVARVESRADSVTQGDDMSTELANLQRQLDELKRQAAPPEARSEYVAAQSRADSVYRAYGDSAPPPVAAERLPQYRVRLIEPLRKHSKRWKGASLDGITNDSVLAEIEAEIYQDAMAEAVRPTHFQSGQIRAISTADPSGRPLTRYVGDPNACWDQFNPPVRYLRRFMTRAQ